jgi:hypothetical protein
MPAGPDNANVVVRLGPSAWLMARMAFGSSSPTRISGLSFVFTAFVSFYRAQGRVQFREGRVEA